LIDWKRLKAKTTCNSQFNLSVNFYPQIRLLPTHPHLLSADFIRVLPVATSADPLLPVGQQQEASVS